MNEMTKAPLAAKTPISTPLAEAHPIGWLRGEIDRLFEGFDSPASTLFRVDARPSAHLPAIEFSDTGKHYRLTAELPGLAEKDVDLEIADGVLTVSGEKIEETKDKEGDYLVNERCYGSFRRQLALPADADADKINAKFKHGVLTVTIAKDEKKPPRSRKIEIHS